mgnify:CR=1 FL=1
MNYSSKNAGQFFLINSKNMKNFIFLMAALCALSGVAQNNNSYWQQHVDYEMDIDVDVDKYQYRGTQKLTYTNNAPEAISQVFYHLYYNAFQPGSEMDARLISIADPDGRMVINKGT